MRKPLIILMALAMPAYGQDMSLIGAGSPAKVGGGGGYTGPGDCSGCVSATTVKAWYGLRAFSAADRGNRLINVCNSTGGTDVACADMLSDSVTGKLVPQTIGGIPCPGTNCTIKIMYDRSGKTSCSGPVACDLPSTISAGITGRPTLGANCNGTQPCIQCDNTKPQGLTLNTITFTQAQALVVSYVADRTPSAAQFMSVFDGGATVQIGFGSVANSAAMYAGGSVQNATGVTDAAWHAIQATANGASSELYVDGTGTAVSPGGSGAGGIGICGPDNAFNGNVEEVGIWDATSALWTSGNKSSMNSNQHGSNGWNF